jgi:hypothetical protein
MSIMQIVLRWYEFLTMAVQLLKISMNMVLPLNILIVKVDSLVSLKFLQLQLFYFNLKLNKLLLSATLIASCSIVSVFLPLAARSGIASNFCSYHFESEENDTIISIEFKLSTNKNLGDFSSIKGGVC